MGTPIRNLRRPVWWIVRVYIAFWAGGVAAFGVHWVLNRDDRGPLSTVAKVVYAVVALAVLADSVRLERMRERGVIPRQTSPGNRTRGWWASRIALAAMASGYAAPIITYLISPGDLDAVSAENLAVFAVVLTLTIVALVAVERRRARTEPAPAA